MKRVLSILVFFLIFVTLFSGMNEILVEKNLNRYYILSKELENVENIDVQVYGSCHAYTSFDSNYFSKHYGLSSYNMSNPSEIIPSTYLRMLERFKKDKPQVVLVETWGINAYDTYILEEKIFGEHLKPNIENIPISREKIKVINEFETLDLIEANFALAKYKGRLLNASLAKEDFAYNFEEISENYGEGTYRWLYDEMERRIANRGFSPTESKEVLDYPELQAYVSEDEIVEVEAVLMKYVDRIIELCEENNVKLIFYRAPYVSKESELKKSNYLEKYLKTKKVSFFDLEKEIEYDYETDFSDHHHLSKEGARKTTDYLGEMIMEMLDEFSKKV